ncbi:MAG: hypothetical protein QF718_07360 [Phycisphaerales bacterium]|nr:hypothetical protein [Phycisphaerales bacterium]
MHLQLLRTTILTLFLMAPSCTSRQTVELLGFDGCPNTPELRKRLVASDPTLQIIDVDLMSLSSNDTRLGWGAPTILIDGKDLFGLEPSGGNVSCRNWSSGLPSIEEIQEAVEEHKK